MSTHYKAVIEKYGNLEISSEQIADINVKDLGNGKFLMTGKDIHEIVELRSGDKESRTYELVIKGKLLRLRLQNPLDQQIEEMKFEQVDSKSNLIVVSPMPGVVTKIHVGLDDKISKGDPLLVLEAMKMENVIKAHCDGQVKSLKVKSGDTVERNQLLVELVL